jgi:isopenicillin N synthase-like dioxygenase
MSLNHATAEQIDEIPVLDLGPYRAAVPGALNELANQLRHALEEVGFYFIRNHGVDQSLIDNAFAAARAFHDQPLDDKLKVKINTHNLGYLPLRGNTIKHSDINKNNKPDLSEGFFVKRQLSADHPDVISNKKFRGQNQWPENLPSVRQAALTYCDALENLGLSLLPVYATALDLPADYFASAFKEPQYSLRLSHYPEQKLVVENEFGVAPHTDTGFMTLLAQNDVPGLSIGTRDGRWIDAPVIKGTFIVNSGDILRRWTNERFLSTPHRVINRSGRERYSIPFFFDPTLDHPLSALPSCVSPENPTKHPPITLLEYLTWHQQRNFNVLQDKV